MVAASAAGPAIPAAIPTHPGADHGAEAEEDGPWQQPHLAAKTAFLGGGSRGCLRTREIVAGDHDSEPIASQARGRLRFERRKRSTVSGCGRAHERPENDDWLG
jgi:hypothetical protein